MVRIKTQFTRVWLSIRSSGGLFWTRYWTLGFRKGDAISCIT